MTLFSEHPGTFQPLSFIDTLSLSVSQHTATTEEASSLSPQVWPEEDLAGPERDDRDRQRQFSSEREEAGERWTYHQETSRDPLAISSQESSRGQEKRKALRWVETLALFD